MNVISALVQNVTRKACIYCGNDAEYFCKVKGKYLCEDCREQHLHEIQQYILKVVE